MAYEIKDRENMKARGQRFSSLARAERELAYAVPASRFVIVDRETGEEVK